MRILHYSLGFPPFRRGGMTTYCMDLMHQQVMNGDQVWLIWPDQFSDWSVKSLIKRRKNYFYPDGSQVGSFSIENAMPIPLIDGIQNEPIFIKKRKKTAYIRFFQENQIDIFHVHTLMGMPCEFLETAKEIGITIIETVHDYFGLCPKCFFLFNHDRCPDMKDCSYCSECNQTALSTWKMHVLESDIYRKVKDTTAVRWMRQEHLLGISKRNSASKDWFPKPFHREMGETLGAFGEGRLKYFALRNYYESMFDLMDRFLFSSYDNHLLFENIYSCGERGRIVSITSGQINNNKKIRKVTGNNRIRIGYLNSVSAEKGFHHILFCCDRLAEQNEHFQLVMYNNYMERSYIITHPPYIYSQLPEVMDSFDVLVVPGFETFGFTVLEALSYGVPVIVKNTVGAKDLIEQDRNGFIADSDEKLIEELRVILKHPEILNRWNEYIVRNTHIKTMREHAEEIRQIYTQVDEQ